MTVHGGPAVLTAAGVVVAATVLLAAVWDRRGRTVRALLGVLVVAALAATAGLQLNRITATYTSWSTLLGAEQEDATVAARAPVHRPAPGGGTVEAVTVRGAASGLTLPMYVYLPAAYRADTAGRTRFPVVVALHGYPGSPDGWVRRLDVAATLDAEIAAGRMAPTVVLFPYQTPRRLLDTECTDLAGGPRAETFLTRDVTGWARTHLRVRPDRAAWGLIGYSAGGFCAMNLALRHPGRYAAAASLSGYASPGITVGDGSEHTTNDVVWRLRHLPPPAVSLYLTWADDDAAARREAGRVTAAARAPLSVTAAVLPRGGHSNPAWRRMSVPAFDWLSSRLARPDG